jgi:hypothetical protein
LQAPQLFTLVPRFASQPFAGLLSQSAKPAKHVNPHMPVVQVGVAFAGARQTLPQLPQFAVVSRGASQPSTSMLLQSSKPASHVPSVHMAFVQSAAPFVNMQAFLQNAQFCAVPSIVSQPSIGSELQSAVPGMQGFCTQLPCLHVSKGEHCVPQPPQLFGSVAGGASQPLAGFLSQSRKPALQAPRPQTPPLQTGIALMVVQTVPHVSQFAGSVLVAASQPLIASMSQSKKPAVHVPTVHAPPAVHAGVAFGTSHGVQDVPHP